MPLTFRGKEGRRVWLALALCWNQTSTPTPTMGCVEGPHLHHWLHKIVVITHLFSLVHYLPNPLPLLLTTASQWDSDIHTKAFLWLHPHPLCSTCRPFQFFPNHPENLQRPFLGAPNQTCGVPMSPVPVILTQGYGWCLSSDLAQEVLPVYILKSRTPDLLCK